MFKYRDRIKPGAEVSARELMEERPMVWTAPKLEEICLGMEINMYYPADERRRRVVLKNGSARPGFRPASGF